MQANTCYGTVGNHQSHWPHLPMLIGPTDETSTVKPAAENDDNRSQRLFGRPDVKLSKCGGPCVSEDVINMAFFGGAQVAL
ncbi:MAG: hypothetical protein JSS86_14270 [Cyanobacteria bacterium SZAS LIN-2]|nr:hypothetical protein [Cyanobacteria bacterium SZAS LIN-2]MBS2010985.1 hypothetical protein [Cyanobacteria bacterium SZAS TMP-1]